MLRASLALIKSHDLRVCRARTRWTGLGQGPGFEARGPTRTPKETPCADFLAKLRGYRRQGKHRRRTGAPDVSMVPPPTTESGDSRTRT